MVEKEKRKRTASPQLRTFGRIIAFISVFGALILMALVMRGFPLRIAVLIICVFAVALSVSAWLFMQNTLRTETTPTLNQIRQSPDDPLIVQQWNGHQWVDTLDMRSAANDGQDTQHQGTEGYR